MNPTITKLRQSYERLQASFTMQNKLEFDQVVWSSLPDLWKSEKPVSRHGKTKYDKTLMEMMTKIAEETKVAIDCYSIHDILARNSHHFKVESVRELMRLMPNSNLVKRGNPKYAEFFTKFGRTAAYIIDPRPVDVRKEPVESKKTSPKPVKPSATTPFIKWFEANYELADGFTPIVDLIHQCGHVISEDRAKDQLKSKGYLVYNRPAGSCVQARPIKKQKSEFVNLTEVLKEMK